MARPSSMFDRQMGRKIGIGPDDTQSVRRWVSEARMPVSHLAYQGGTISRRRAVFEPKQLA